MISRAFMSSLLSLLTNTLPSACIFVFFIMLLILRCSWAYIFEDRHHRAVFDVNQTAHMGVKCRLTRHRLCCLSSTQQGKLRATTKPHTQCTFRLNMMETTAKKRQGSHSKDWETTSTILLLCAAESTIRGVMSKGAG